MIDQDITIYAGQDFGMTYIVPPGSDMDLSQYEAVCKIRKRPYDDMKLELTPVVQSKQVGFFISGKDSAKAQLKGWRLPVRCVYLQRSQVDKVRTGDSHHRSRYFNA